jgi:hypothetical protein
VTGIELKIEAMRRGLPLYLIAAEAKMHPARLSRFVNGRIPLTDEDRVRILTAIQRLSSEHGQG